MVLRAAEAAREAGREEPRLVMEPIRLEEVSAGGEGAEMEAAEGEEERLRQQRPSLQVRPSARAPKNRNCCCWCCCSCCCSPESEPCRRCMLAGEVSRAGCAKVGLVVIS